MVYFQYPSQYFDAAVASSTPLPTRQPLPSKVGLAELLFSIAPSYLRHCQTYPTSSSSAILQEFLVELRRDSVSIQTGIETRLN
ncbi:hypothetical protein B3C1_11157 [Gallaecimonas xiamenensis 3-C-1]|uniref:Uncharacterized protein n=1 Tax=Gallaecimonas xiamenensis 3-C-1 TaxID=745411 RepID=K2IQC6_9GAMM|nr:hypothetical protein B3C1_11157 [Gallaecimonas xiamenensis 3-C-1]